MTASSALPDPARNPAIYRGVVLKRALAWVFDMVLIVILCVLILPFTAFLGVFFFPVLMLVIGFIYRWFTIAAGSATWGMQIVGITLRDHRARRLSSETALLHTLGYTVSVAVAPLQLISVLMMVFSSRKQGLTDHLLGTAAINQAAQQPAIV
ncbi:RDD family protein [Yoonia sp. SS1-5]|uniref:RDD family protein n=1 Tax=Yoonia rhodophyticola TaxID=3137370 RepID=A0AAN0M7Q4_9RHOB